MGDRGARVRVLRVITRLNIGGPSIQALELTRRLDARGYESTLAHGVVSAEEGDMRAWATDFSGHDGRIVQIPALRRAVAPHDDLRASLRVLALLRRLHPAILHTHMAKAGAAGRIAAFIYNRVQPRAHRVRVVHTYHGHVLEGYFGPFATKTFIAIERVLSRATDRIIAISPAIRDELVDRHRIGTPDQYRIVPLGFDLRGFAAIDDAQRVAARCALGIAPDAPVVTTVGRLTAIKEQHVLLAAARLVVDRTPNALFLIVGDGERRARLEADVAMLRLQPNVRFLGWRRDLPTIYAATDVFALTSRNEGTPVAIVESLASGVPAVSTDVGGVRDVVEDRVTGLLAPTGDAAQIAQHLVVLLRDRPLRRTMGERGRQSVLTRYGIDRLVDDIDHVYRELIA